MEDYMNNTFLKLVVAHCDGTSTEAQQRMLTKMLIDNSELRRQFVLHLQVHAALKFGGSEFLGENVPTCGIPNIPLTEPSFMEGPNESALLDFGDMNPLDGTNETTAGGDAVFRSSLFSLFTFLSQPIPLGIIMICVLVLPIAMLAWDFSKNQPKVAPTCVLHGQVVKTVACTWDEEQGIGLQTGDLLVGNQEYHLKEGVLQLNFASGVQAIIQGPAVFRSKSSMLLEFTKGRLYAKVPPEGKNFTVAMDGLEVIDRGTEFGIFANKIAEVELHVFKGRIDVLADRWKQSGSGQPLELREGKARRVDRLTGKVEEIAVDESKFVRDFSDKSGLNFILVNPSFEEPSILEHPKQSRVSGDLRNVVISGWEVMGTAESPFYLQQAPYTEACDQDALDGTQMLAVKLTDQVDKAWAFQSIGTIKVGDIGKTLIVSTEVIAKKLKGSNAQYDGNTATAILAFTIGANENEPGEVIGFPGFTISNITNAKSRHLKAKLNIRPNMIGKKISVQLLIRDAKVEADRQNEYFFDQVDLNHSPGIL